MSEFMRMTFSHTNRSELHETHYKYSVLQACLHIPQMKHPMLVNESLKDYAHSTIDQRSNLCWFTFIHATVGAKSHNIYKSANHEKIITNNLSFETDGMWGSKRPTTRWRWWTWVHTDKTIFGHDKTIVWKWCLEKFITPDVSVVTK